MSDNLIDPIEAESFSDIQKFIQANVCSLCLGELLPSQGTGSHWQAVCPTCGQPVYRHTFVKREEAASVEQQRRGAERDLRPEKPKQSPEEIIKQLGF